MRKNNEFLFRMRELKASDEEVKRLAEGIEKMAVAYPGVAVADALEKGCDALETAFEEFNDIGVRVSARFLKEDFNFKSAMTRIKIHVNAATNYFKALKRYSRKEPDSGYIIERLDLHCENLDEYVNMSNRVIHSLIEEGKWIDDYSLEYKRLYMELTGAVSQFYNLLPMVITDWKNYIRKTRNVKGELLRADAEQPSYTDNCKYAWLTDSQWTIAMDPSELKNNPDFKERMMEMHWQKMREEYETRMRGNRLDEMSQFRPEETGLPVSVWVDNDGRPLHHGPRIKFDPMNGTTVSRKYPPITISLTPFVPDAHLYDIRTKTKDIDVLKGFIVKAEQCRLKRIRDGIWPVGYRLTEDDFKTFFQKNLKGESFA